MRFLLTLRARGSPHRLSKGCTMTTRFMASSLAVAILVAATGKTGIADFPVVPQYALIDLGTLDPIGSEAFALNDDGTVVGEAGPINVAHAFQYLVETVY